MNIHRDATLNVTNGTIVNNLTERGAGGIDTDGVVTLANTIVAGNRMQTGEDSDIATITRITAAFSLIGAIRLGMISDNNNNLTGIDPQLGVLRDNGGTTQTHVPLIGSPVIDAGNPAFDAVGTPFDQRGTPFSRVADGGSGTVTVDIGGVEFQAK